MKKLPLIRLENIVTQETGDELMIYDLLANKAFCLNETSAKIFNACDGKQTFTDLKSKYNFSDDLINLALDELNKNNLLAEKFESPISKINRRDVIKKVGLASMIALPLITAVIAPKAVNAASGSVNNCPPGYECIAANTSLCGARTPGTYRLEGYSSTNGTCSGTYFGFSFATCPSAGTEVNDLCLNTAAEPEVG